MTPKMSEHSVKIAYSLTFEVLQNSFDLFTLSLKSILLKRHIKREKYSDSMAAIRLLVWDSKGPEKERLLIYNFSRHHEIFLSQLF